MDETCYGALEGHVAWSDERRSARAIANARAACRRLPVSGCDALARRSRSQRPDSIAIRCKLAELLRRDQIQGGLNAFELEELRKMSVQ